MKRFNRSIFLSFMFLCGVSLCIGAALCAGNAGGGSSSLLSVSPILAGGVKDFFSGIGAFFATNWKWFAIGGGAFILLLIIIIAIAVSRRKKKKKRAKEELLARTLELKQPEESENAEQEVQEQTAEESQVEVEETAEQKVEVEEPASQTELPPSMFEGHKPYPEVMDYIKMRMRFDQNKQAQAQRIIDTESPVVDERVRQIQREYQEELRKIDEIMHEQEKEKLHEEMKKEQEMIDKLEEEYAIADNLLDELSQPNSQKQNTAPQSAKTQPEAEKVENKEPAIFDYRIIAGEKPKDYSGFSNIQVHITNADQPQAQEPTPVDDSATKKVASDAIVISVNKKQSFKEAFDELPAKQKHYFNKLRDYADKKEGSRAKEGKNYVVVGCGNKHYVKLTIKRNTVVACFLLESEEMQRLRLEEKLPVKPEETQIKVVDDKTFAVAKQMIDLRINQIERENQIVKELRKEKRKQAKK